METKQIQRTSDEDIVEFLMKVPLDYRLDVEQGEFPDSVHTSLALGYVCRMAAARIDEYSDQYSVQWTGLFARVNVVIPWRRFLSWLARAFTASR